MNLILIIDKYIKNNEYRLYNWLYIIIIRLSAFKEFIRKYLNYFLIQ